MKTLKMVVSGDKRSIGRWSVLLLIFSSTLLGTYTPCRAQSFIGDVAPDLTPCLDNGYTQVTTSLGQPFKTEDECVKYVALGFELASPKIFPWEEGEADFFITNDTDTDLQLDMILSSKTEEADDITFGRSPSEFQPGTLPNPLAVPNWPQHTILKLKFLYTSARSTRVNWHLRIKGAPSEFKFYVNNSNPHGWDTTCINEFLFRCNISPDTVHVIIR